MSDQPEDYNAFNAWDSFGATLTLGLVPAVMNYVFTEEHEIGTTIGIAVVATIISLLVLGLSLITRWRIIGSLVNLAGCVLTPVYIVIAVCAWWPSDKEQPADTPAAEQAAPAKV